jgi:hypothetical protein
MKHAPIPMSTHFNTLLFCGGATGGIGGGTGG